MGAMTTNDRRWVVMYEEKELWLTWDEYRAINLLADLNPVVAQDLALLYLARQESR
jgi:hypothetical protein